MKNKTLQLLTLSAVMLVGMFAFSPHTNAYFTTAQDAIDLGNGTGLFLIKYAFGMPTKEVHLPVFAQDSTEKDVSKVSYEVRDGDDERVVGKSFGIVLSDAHISSGMYVTEKGSAHTFILAVFFTPDTITGERYHLQVTDLPFNFDGTQQLKLNPSELDYYTTPSLKL